jgi:hypothetical protein
LIILFPAGLGYVAGTGIYLGWRNTKTFSQIVVLATGIGMGLAGYVALKYFEYRKSLELALQNLQAVRLGFFEYLRIRLKAGEEISDGPGPAAGRDKGLNLGSGGTAVLWLVELGIVCFFAFRCGSGVFGKPEPEYKF